MSSTTAAPSTRTASLVDFGEGDHVRLLRPVDRFPHFVAPEGATGVATEVSDSLIRVRLDEKLEGAEHWDNEVCWSLTDGDEPGLDVAPSDKPLAAALFEA
jgi:hypothetical protein